MIDFLKNITSIYWWISVVVVGIMINLISYYLRKRLDNRLSAMSTWWSTRSKKQKDKRQKLILRLRNSQHEQILFAFSEMRCRIGAVMSLVFTLTFIVMFPLLEKYFFPVVDMRLLE